MKCKTRQGKASSLPKSFDFDCTLKWVSWKTSAGHKAGPHALECTCVCINKYHIHKFEFGNDQVLDVDTDVDTDVDVDLS